MHVGSIEAEELHTALETNSSLRRRLAEVVGVSSDEALEIIEQAIVGRCAPLNTYALMAAC